MGGLSAPPPAALWAWSRLCCNLRRHASVRDPRDCDLVADRRRNGPAVRQSHSLPGRIDADGPSKGVSAGSKMFERRAIQDQDRPPPQVDQPAVAEFIKCERDGLTISSDHVGQLLVTGVDRLVGGGL